MKFENADQVKNWLRQMPIAKKELNLKINLYNDLITEQTHVIVADKRVAFTNDATLKRIKHYRSVMAEAQKKFDEITSDWERIQNVLNSEEITLITEKYLKGTSWTAMEFVMFYSRRQCFRMLNRAVEKLIGQEVSCSGNFK